MQNAATAYDGLILMATHVYLIRHGQTDWNRDGICMGQADIPLNDLGQEQARRTGERLRALPISAIYASDLGRTVETARPLAEALQLSITSDASFRELDYGNWEGLHQEELPQHYPEEFQEDPRLNPLSFHPDGGESVAQLYERVTSAFERIVDAHPDETVVIVAHGGVIRCLANDVLGNGAHAMKQTFFSLGFAVSNGGVTLVRVEPDPSARLVFLNDTCHLDGLSESPEWA